MLWPAVVKVECQPWQRPVWIYDSKVYWRFNMFRAAHRSSSGTLNCICSLWFIYTCGDRPFPWQRPVTTWVYKPEAANTVWSSWWWAVSRLKHVEPSINFGIINSITNLHLVCISTESYYDGQIHKYQIHNLLVGLMGSRGSSICIMTRPQAGRPRSFVSSLGRKKIFSSSPKYADRPWGLIFSGY